MIDSDDIEFMQIAADALDFNDAEYRSLLDDMQEEDAAWEAEEAESEYELDESWPDDDWLDAGEEWELSPDYEGD